MYSYPEKIDEMLQVENDEERAKIAEAWKNFNDLYSAATKKPDHKKEGNKKQKVKQAKASRKKNRR